MPRQARLDAPGALHHVMGRGIEGQLNLEYGIPMAEIARHVGVCTPAIANALRKRERENNK